MVQTLSFAAKAEKNRVRWQFSLPMVLFFLFSVAALTQSFAVFQGERSQITALLQSSGLALLVFGYFIFNRSRVLFVRSTSQTLAAAMFLFYAGLTSFWSIDPLGSLAYAAAAAALLYSLGLFMTADRQIVEQTCLRAAYALLIAVLALPFFLQVRERSFGFIAPNLIASFGFVCIVLASFSTSRWRWIPILGGFWLIVFSEGRTILVAAVAYLCILGMRRWIRSARNQVVAFIGLAVAMIVVALNWETFSSLIVSVVSAPLGITQAGRLDGTLTGRADHWIVGLQLAEQRWFEGFGFGTRQTSDLGFGSPAHNAHSGAINMILDLGVIGSSIFVLWLYLTGAFFFRASHRENDSHSWHMLSFLAAYLLLLAVEPNYLALQHPIAIMLFMALGAPIFRSYSAGPST